MRPVRTPESNALYTLPGGNEDNFLHAEEGGGIVKSVWHPNPDERRLIAGGADVVLLIYGALVPPVMIGIDRPFCSGCKQRMEWASATQRYVCKSSEHDEPGESAAG